MKPPRMSRLVALANLAALLPKSNADSLLPPSPPPIISPCAGRRYCPSAFIPRFNNKPTNSLSFRGQQRHGFTKILDVRSNNNVAATQHTRYVTTQIEMTSSPSQRTSPSPWSPGQWKMTLDFGKEESLDEYDNSQLSNLLGEEWGSNGGRLVLSFEVFVSAETMAEDERSVQMSWLGGKPTGTVECILQSADNEEDYCTSYINEKGQQNVDVMPGQWRIEPPLPLLPTYVNILPGQASTLRFYLTLASSIQRNTINFPQDQLLLLQSNTFRTEQYSSGIQTLLPYQYEKEKAQKRLEEQLNHETGDRRLDGGDLLETLGGYKDAAELVMERDEKRRKWKEIEGELPKLNNVNTGRKVEIDKLLDDEKRWGIWPGDTELLTSERGVILAAVKKEQKGGLLSWMQDDGAEEPVVVGKWSILPIFDDIN